MSHPLLIFWTTIGCLLLISHNASMSANIISFTALHAFSHPRPLPTFQFQREFQCHLHHLLPSLLLLQRELLLSLLHLSHFFLPTIPIRLSLYQPVTSLMIQWESKNL
jgi:hypothetical protein